MADVVPSNPTGIGRKVPGKAGAAITAGQWVYYDSATDSYKLADADAAATALVVGVVTVSAANGGDVLVLVEGEYDPGVNLNPGLIYVLSSTPGAMCPIADQVPGTGKYVSMLGRGNTAQNLAIAINQSLNAIT